MALKTSRKGLREERIKWRFGLPKKGVCVFQGVCEIGEMMTFGYSWNGKKIRKFPSKSDKSRRIFKLDRFVYISWVLRS